jgi:hypothetical protein
MNYEYQNMAVRMADSQSGIVFALLHLAEVIEELKNNG